jgi:hypothetical protein
MTALLSVNIGSLNINLNEVADIPIEGVVIALY